MFVFMVVLGKEKTAYEGWGGLVGWGMGIRDRAREALMAEAEAEERRRDEVEAAAEGALTRLEAAEAEAAEARHVLAEMEDVWRGRVMEARGEAEAARAE